MNRLAGSGTDLFTLSIEACRSRGIPVVASYRMNSEDWYSRSYLLSDFGREHPEWRISLTDEETEAVYNEIPVLPRIGPLINRPRREGQMGYVMLVNAPPYLQSGAQVTVVLGTYAFNHVTVQ